MEKFTLGPKEIGRRIDKILALKFSQYSRAYIKEQIRLGSFLVYSEKEPTAIGKKVKPFYELREGDFIAFAPDFSPPKNTAILPNPGITLDIIYEDENVIAINKPAGLAVHPRQDRNGRPLASEIDNTLASGLLSYYPEINKIKDKFTLPSSTALEEEGNNEANLRPGIVHRLDKDTSGVMIVAKSQNAFDWLKKQFKERKVTKKYIALVHGHLKEKQGVLENFLSRSATDPSKQKISDQGRLAITEYKTIKEFANYSLIEAYPETGRLHQIRVQLAAIGHPVVGGTKYDQPNLPKPDGLKRQFLHAQELQITLPNAAEISLKSPLPSDLSDILAALEKN